MYLQHKLPISISFDNNMYKKKVLTIEDSALLYLDKRKLLSNYYFKADIIAI